MRPVAHLALLRQILTTRSLHRSSHRPTKLLTEQAEAAFGKAEAARPRDHSLLRHSSDGLAGAGGPKARRVTRRLRGRPAKIAARDLLWPRSDAGMLGVEE